MRWHLPYYCLSMDVSRMSQSWWLISYHLKSNRPSNLTFIILANFMFIFQLLCQIVDRFKFGSLIVPWFITRYYYQLYYLLIWFPSSQFKVNHRHLVIISFWISWTINCQVVFFFRYPTDKNTSKLSKRESKQSVGENPLLF